MNKVLNDYFRALDQTQKLFFSFCIQRDYYLNQVQNEKKIIVQSQKLFTSLKKVREFFQNDFHSLIPSFEHLYEVVFSLDLLKNRLFDHATFEICESELQSISQAISLILVDIQKPIIQDERDQGSLKVLIQNFEMSFQNTLQFVVADPLIFVFFIRDLYKLDDLLIFLRKKILDNYEVNKK